MGLAVLLGLGLVAVIVAAGLVVLTAEAGIRGLAVTWTLFTVFMPQGLRPKKCWQVRKCGDSQRLSCPAFKSRWLPCWVAVRLGRSVQQFSCLSCLQCLRGQLSNVAWKKAA